MTDGTYVVQPIGRVESELVDRAAAPLQGDEGGSRRQAGVRPERERGYVTYSAKYNQQEAKRQAVQVVGTYDSTLGGASTIPALRLRPR